ncbi:MAG: 6-carboxytetrahydropterin synthase [Bacteroidia bacterium]|nr:6-carboxytetrahydropterin synthase [Bacteroidia bacterium]
MVYITRRERFCAAHKLYREDWPAEKNLEIFGKCSNPNWHGHNYDLYVTVKSKPDPETGFVVDYRIMSEIITEKIIDKVDHRNLNLDVDFMKGIMTSTENLAIAIWKELEEPFRQMGVVLYSVRIQETENNSVEYFGQPS